MLYTTSQVAEKLGVGRQAVLRWVRTGDLVPVNSPKPGAQRCQFKFSSAALTEFTKSRRNGEGNKQASDEEARAAGQQVLAERYKLIERLGNKGNGVAAAPIPDVNPPVVVALFRRLGVIEAKLDQVLELWR